MKKILVVLAIVIFGATQVNAQEPSFLKGSKVLNLGIGMPYLLVGYHMVIPPISASMDIGIVDGILKKAAVGVGPYVGFSSRKYEYLTYGYKYTDIVIGARGSFHYPFLDKLDTYAGVLIGWNVTTYKEIGTPVGLDPDKGHLAHSEFIGARYYFSNNLAVFAELGYGISWLTGGIALKF
ncbi:MAG: hypothetical protein MUF36_12715 [Bacteroidales bacterium]|jgi:hypothetical protein|nr:hypothetical protein [Bacteroidales bacterium]